MASKVAIEVEIKNIKKVADLKESLKTLRKETKAYEKEVAEGTKQTEKSAKGYINSSKAIKNQSKDLRNLKKDLSGSTKATKAATKSSNGMAKQFVKGAAAIGLAVSAFKAVTGAISSAIESFKAFEFQMAKVRAITGSNDTQFKMLTDSAKELGRTTFFTATEVAKLQTNYGKLGFTTGEILKAQEATLALATATDTDLARAATVAGAAVRGFGLDASETARVTDVMAVSFTSSAMDIEKWQTSMTKVAPIAAAAGISVESTAAVMSKLTDTGIEASIAGTSLRNIFLKMQDSSSDLSKFLGYTVNSSTDLDRALRDLNDAGLSNEQVMELVDLRQVAAFNTMVRGAEDIANLTLKFNEANGALNEMVDIIEDTLEGDIKKLTSATDGLKTELGEELSPSIRGITQDLTKLTNAATDNADAIAEIGNKIFEAFKSSFGIKVVTKAFDGLKVALNGLTGTEGWREFSDLIGLTTTKKDNSAADRLDRLNESLQATLDLSNSNTKNTKASIFATEQAINIRQKELDLIKGKQLFLKSSEGLDVFNEGEIDGEKDRLEKELKLLRESLAKREDILFEFEGIEKENKATTAASAKKIKDKEDAIALTTAKAVRDKAFADEKAIIDIEARELNNIQKELLINEQITQETYDAMAFDAEQQRLQDQLDLYIKYQEDTSVINGQMLSNELRMISEKAAAEKTAFDKKVAEDAQEKKDREEKIGEMQEMGNQLILIAGEEENLQGVKQAGIAISRSAAIATSFEAMADYGKAITSAAADSPWYLKIINVVGLIASMASTLSLIKSMKSSFGDGGMIEEFADGGMVNGKSHAQGGEKFAVGGRVVELEGGEAVINKRSTAMFRNQLSSMNSAGGGVKFADGGLMSSPSFTESSFAASNQSAMMGAMGGQRKVVVVESDITTSQSTVSVIQSNASF